MGAAARALLGLLGAVLLLLLLAALRKPLARLLKLAAKTGVGLGVLALLHALGGGLGLTLGVNLCNALVLALLGLPGLGLLMMLNWVVGL